MFFPCEHHAVCQECVIREKIHEFGSIESVQPNSHYNCPLCSEVIKKILPCENGLEVEKYWQWVLEVKPELPNGFTRNFKHSAAIIQKIHIDENIRLKKLKEKPPLCSVCCTVS